MTRRVYILLAIAPILAGCGGPAGQTFTEKSEVHESLFAHVESLTNTVLMPNGQAVYTGVVGMTLDIDGIPQATVTADAGDFHAIGDFSVTVNVGLTSDISGVMNNFTADEGHDLTGTLTIPTTTFSGSQFSVPYTDSLSLNGSPLVFSGTFAGLFKGSNAEWIWGGNNGTTTYDDGSGLQNGTLLGGFVGQ